MSGDASAPIRSGFVTLAGRPNVGKSTLLNRMVGEKVSITSSTPQTTRIEIRGVLNRPDAQLVFVDTPGLHRPRTPLGERLNATAAGALDDVDVVCFVVDATAPFGTGDRWVGERIPRDSVCVVNKVDVASSAQIAEQLQAAGELDLEAYFPVSALTGEGIGALVEHVVERLPEGPAWYPTDVTTDLSDAVWVAELVREELLAVARDEVPHSIATRVSEWELPRIRVEILVERDSQKGIVIGRRASRLERVRTAVQSQLDARVAEPTRLELFVKVDKNWQRRPGALDRLGY